MTRRAARFGGLLLTAVLAVAACGGDDDDDAGDTAPSDTSATTEAGGAATTAPATEGGSATTAASDEGTATTTGDTEAPDTTEMAEGTPGGSLIYGTYGEGSGFDPIKRGLGYCNTALYDSLLRFDDEGNPEPYMAESMTTEDNITWTLKLREGVQFHDGTPLDADAVIYNIERHQDPANASALATQVEPIESMTAVDDLTVEFVLNRPFAVFDSAFAQANGLGIILSPTALQEKGPDFNLDPVGAGPFVFQEWIPDDHLTLVKNENYWQEGLPYLDELVCRPLPDTQTRQQAILNGDVDLTYMITVTEIDGAKDAGNLTVHDSLGNGAEGIILNDNQPPFDDPRMREAFVSLLNLDVIADVRLNGHRELAGAIGLIAPTSPVYNPEVEDVWPQYDVERATQLIEEYRAEGNDPNFTFKLPNTPDRRRFGEMAGQFFSDAGLDVTMEYLDISEFVTGVLNTGDFQAAINSYPAFIGQYPQMWNAYHTGGLSNFGQFSDPEIDALLETAVSSTDEDEATQAWKDVQVKIAEAIPYATYGRSPSAIIVQPYVQGVDKYLDNTLWFATLWRDDQ